MPERFHVSTIAIIGVGLIGGSLALALKREKRVDQVIGVGRSRANLERALHLGVIDQIADDPAHAVAQAEITILATPVNTIAGLFETILPAIKGDKVITDVGSVKLGICEAAVALGDQRCRFVPGHPIAGKENSGVDSATAELFADHNVVLTPQADTDADALELTRQMWIASGAKVLMLDATVHDRVLAMTSHLPHVLAYAMVDVFAHSTDLADCYAMAAGGFYDFSRTASSDPEMWRDICMMNRTQLMQHIDQFSDDLARIRRMIDESDGAALEDLFRAAKEARSLVAERRKPV